MATTYCQQVNKLKVYKHKNLLILIYLKFDGKINSQKKKETKFVNLSWM